MLLLVNRFLFALLAGLLVSSCSTVKFYSQAMRGQAEIMGGQRPVKEVLADPAETDLVKKKLRLALELREYAKTHLKLPGESFGTYTDLKRPFVVWVVYAAETFQTEPKQWWYPLVGKLAYRGFFSQEDARQEATKLKGEGYDVFAAGVEAYSTLGFFKDPILNTGLHRSDAEFAELIFHELTHARVFVPGDTDFNEAFATANAEAAVRHWLKSKGRHAELRDYEKKLRLENTMIRLALETREKLRQLYAGPNPTLEAKNGLLTRLQSQLASMGMKDKAADVKTGKELKLVWNNARLNTLSTYHTLVPGFERLLKQCGCDHEAFYKSVEDMKNLSNVERKQALGME